MSRTLVFFVNPLPYMQDSWTPFLKCDILLTVLAVSRKKKVHLQDIVQLGQIVIWKQIRKFSCDDGEKGWKNFSFSQEPIILNQAEISADITASAKVHNEQRNQIFCWQKSVEKLTEKRPEIARLALYTLETVYPFLN